VITLIKGAIMDAQQAQQDISIIKQMIDQTRQKTAESGHLFISIGVVSAIMVIFIGLLEMYGLNTYVLPTIIILTLLNAGIGFYIASRKNANGNVHTYTKTIFWNTIMMCGFAAVLFVFVFPFLNIYPFSATPILTAVVLGIAVFLTGSLFEDKFIQWSGLFWWIGACLIALAEGPIDIFIMVTIIILGWIVPGIRLNKNYKKGV
jgi:hypothetical protein